MEIPVQDHIIVGKGCYTSMRNSHKNLWWKSEARIQEPDIKQIGTVCFILASDFQSWSIRSIKSISVNKQL